MPERWLVISHEAGNSGAPRMLLEVLRGVQAARGAAWSCEILLARGGVLLGEFAKVGPVHVMADRRGKGKTLGAGLFRKFIDRPWLQPRKAGAWFRRWRGGEFDLVYNNTATNGHLVPLAKSLGAPVITHVHELGYAMRRFNTSRSLAQTVENTDHFLAVSTAVSEDLRECGVAPDRITIAPNFLPALPPPAGTRERTELRARLAVDDETHVIVGCGHIDWVKGPDLFVDMATSLVSKASSRKLLFVWVGGEFDVRFARRLRRLVRRRGLENVVRFVGAVESALPWFAGSDVVVVTSRVESFSLVALEAAALGIPVVGFASARGLASVLGGEPELLVPEFDATRMAGVVDELLSDRFRADQQGQRLRAKVEREFLAGPGIETILQVTDRLRASRP